MKRFWRFLFPAALCLLLAGGCADAQIDLRATTAEDTSAQAVYPVPDDASVRNAFEKAMEVYGWFDLCALDSDSADTAEHGGHTYNRVVSDAVASYDALRMLVYDLFETQTAERLLQENSAAPPYIDVDGVLYGQDFARGSDVTKGGYTLSVAWESNTCALCRVRVETVAFSGDLEDYRQVTGYEEYTYHYQRVGNRWVFTDFDLFY